MLQSSSSWRITVDEKLKYDSVFSRLEPIDGKISGKKARQVLVNSKLPNALLSKIWTLSDYGADGKLCDEEFAVAMHLVYICREGKTIPDELPTDLVPPSAKAVAATVAAISAPSVPVATVANVAIASSTAPLIFRSAPTAPAVVTAPSISQTAPVAPTAYISPVSEVAITPDIHPLGGAFGPTSIPASIADILQPDDWVVSLDDLKIYSVFFKDIDVDNDGFVDGSDCKSTFLSSELPPNPTLASIWALCDVDKQNKLNFEQFSLAMYLISRKVQGVNVPDFLTSNMIPPSSRNKILPACAPVATVAATVPLPHSFTSVSEHISSFPEPESVIAEPSPSVAPVEQIRQAFLKPVPTTTPGIYL